MLARSIPVRDWTTPRASGPWTARLQNQGSVHELPDYADIPQAGERIEGGSPILTFFARADTLSRCRESLQALARDLDRLLYERLITAADSATLFP